MHQTSSLLIALMAILLNICSSSRLTAQVLQNFERDATKSRPTNNKTTEHHHHSHFRSHSNNTYHQQHSHNNSDSLTDGLAEGALLFCGAGFLAGGANSWYRMRPDDDPEPFDESTSARKLGEPLIPLVRLDGSYQGIERYVDAWDYRIQAGYGPFAIEYADSRYREKSPVAYMDVRRWTFLYRMTIANQLEIDLGLGSTELNGINKNHSFTFSLPILYYPKPYIGLEFRPSWARFNGSRFNEYDIAAIGNYRGIGLKGGYRWLTTPNSSLHGPYLGVVVRF